MQPLLPQQGFDRATRQRIDSCGRVITDPRPVTRQLCRQLLCLISAPLWFAADHQQPPNTLLLHALLHFL
jgi:hypothetical protein